MANCHFSILINIKFIGKCHAQEWLPQGLLRKNLVTFLKWFAAFLAAAIGGFGTITPAMAAPFAYVGGGEGLGISVIDTATNKLVATIWAKRAIGGVAVSSDGKRAYVTANGPSAGTGSVEVIDTVNHTVIADVPMPTLAGGGGIAIAANGKYA